MEHYTGIVPLLYRSLSKTGNNNKSRYTKLLQDNSNINSNNSRGVSGGEEGIYEIGRRPRLKTARLTGRHIRRFRVRKPLSVKLGGLFSPATLFWRKMRDMCMSMSGIFRPKNLMQRRNSCEKTQIFSAWSRHLYNDVDHTTEDGFLNFRETLLPTKFKAKDA